MIERICPPVVRVAERYGTGDLVGMFPEEAEVVEGAVRKRQLEFATVRHCAREVLACLGLPAVPILPGQRGAPVWPIGVVGSLTHCAGFHAAAVARDSDLCGIGIDAEPNRPLPHGVLAAVTSVAERTALDTLPRTPTVCWDRLLFCVKEAVYKALFPATRLDLRFADAVVDIRPAGSFAVTRAPGGEARLRGLPEHLDGRWVAEDGLLATVVLLAPDWSSR